jgi:membrane-associated phospholipid phosphatase
MEGTLARWAGEPGGRLRPRRLAVIIAGGYVVFTATYVPINLFSVGRNAYTLFLPGEERLPFLPVFEYLYFLTYLIGPQLYWTVRDSATLARLLRATAMALATAYLTYLAFPVYLERPHLEVNSLHTWLLSVEYLDKPYNHFPSLHVTLSWLAVHAAQVSPRSRALLALLTTGISASTVFVKQHYIADVLYGFVLAWGTWWLAGRRGRDATAS